MPPESRADDAPSESATAPVSGSSPGEDTAMEVDEGAIGLPPTSPVSQEDDDLLDENEAVEVEAGLAHLTVSSPSGQVGEGEGGCKCLMAQPATSSRGDGCSPAYS